MCGIYCDQFSVNYPDSSKNKIGDLLKEYGVVVIQNVFSESESNKWMDDIVSNIETISGGKAKRDSVWETWIEKNLPPQTRHGHYQSCLSNLKAVWEIRTDNRVKDIFQRTYSKLKNEELNEFICTLDGINVQANVVNNELTNSYEKPKDDWAHVDQRKEDMDVFKCVQGQAVLTNSTACFRATPKSHHFFIEIMNMDKTSSKTCGCSHFTPNQLKKMKNLFEEENIGFQIPIHAPKGSFIIWLSTTIHSAISVSQTLPRNIEDPFCGWRGVVFVCYRPKSEFSENDIKKLEDAVKNNLSSNHWGTTIFDKYPGNSGHCQFSEEVRCAITHPESIYDKLNYRPEKSQIVINAK